MSTWLFSLDDGAVPLVITQHVEIPSISRERRLHTELKANVNVCAFRCRFNADLWSYLISSTSIQITITKDSAAYFAGYISPNFEATIRDGQKYIELRAEDYSLKKLGQTITAPLVCPGYAVCNPAAPAASLVHVIAAAAGVTVSPAAPTISTIVPYMIVLADDKTDYATVLGNILFEHQHVYNFTESGLLDIVPYVNPGTITPAGTLSTAAGTRNLRGSLVQKKVAEKYDDIRVSYSEVELKNGLVLFQDTAGATAALACNIELAAAGDADGKDYYPKTADDGEVFASWKSPDGYDIVIATSAAMDVTLGSGIVVQRALTNYYRKCSFGYRNTAAAARSITKMRITGSAYVRTSKNTARVAKSGAADLFEHDCEYVFAKAAAQALAAALAQYYRFSDMGYAAKSKTAFALGAYVTVEDPVYSGISTVCRVVGISESEQQPGLYTYTLEGAADFESVAIVTEGESTPPSSPNLGGQTPQEVANAIELAQKTLTLSAPYISRSRADALSPAAVTASAKNADGTAYAGRIKIALTTNGSTWMTVYTSSADESSKTYTVPATYSSAYVTGVRVSLYAAGGTTTLLREVTVPVALDSSASAIYWGALTSAPTAGMILGDYYFDSNLFASGGGAIRYYDGLASWTEATSAWAYYNEARAKAINDIVAWIVDNDSASGSLVAYAKAMIVSLWAYDLSVGKTLVVGGRYAADGSVADANATGMYCNNTGLWKLGSSKGELMFDPSSGEGSFVDIPIRSYAGEGVKRRATQLDNDSLDYLDSPLGGAEQLRARIGRLGVGDSIIMDGDFNAEIEAPWSLASIIVSSSSNYPAIIQQANRTLRLVYKRNSDNYLVQRTSADDGATWSAESVINAAATSICAIIQQSDETIRVVYRRGSDDYLVQRTSADDGAAWSAESVINAAGSNYPDLIQSMDGLIRVVYQRLSDLHIVQRTSEDGIVWSDELTVRSSSANDPSLIQQRDGKYRITFRDGATTYLYQQTSDDGITWSSASIINPAGTGDGDIFQQLDDTFRVLYRNSSGYLSERISADGVLWSAESVIDNTVVTVYPDTALLSDGSYFMVYLHFADGKIASRTLARYAKVGAGIIRSSRNSYGTYIILSDGTLIQWGSHSASLAISTAHMGGYRSAAVGVNFPYPFVGRAS